jgi:hypothetical protein
MTDLGFSHGAEQRSGLLLGHCPIPHMPKGLMANKTRRRDE